jgi:hypothetical protein
VVNSGKRLRAHVGIDEGNVGDDHVSTAIYFCLLHSSRLCFYIYQNFPYLALSIH